MRFGSQLLSAALVLLCVAALVTAQVAGPADKTAPRIEKVSPDVVAVGTAAVDVTLNGRLFEKEAVVRARVKGEKGAGVDLTTTFDGPAQLRVSLPATLVAKPGMLELRVKNPGGAVSDWVSLEVRVAAAVPTPTIDRVSPLEVKALARDVFVTAIGRDLVDQAVVTITSAAGTTEVRGHAVREGLTFKVPDAHLARPGGVTFTIANPGGRPSAPARFDVVTGEPGGQGGGTSDGVSIVSLLPDRVDLRTATSATVKITARGVNLMSSRVLLRREGEASDGKIIPQTTRREAGDTVELTVTLTKAMVREPGNYEIRVFNGDGTQSNWARLVVAGGSSPIGQPEAIVTAVIPESITLTSATVTAPVEVSVRNTGDHAVRVTEFRAIYPDGSVVKLEGAVVVERASTGQIRLGVPVDLGLVGAGRAGAVTKFAVAWGISATAGRGPVVEGRHPEKDFASVTVRNQIVHQAIAREYVTAAAAGAPEGWRFFKTTASEKVDGAVSADFSLFTEPFAAASAIKTVEVFNYRPGDNDRGLFFLTLTSAETAPGDPRTVRERGTRLGYLVTEARVGLVPLYRWVLGDGRRAINHYLTIEKDAAKLPRQMQRKGWKLDTAIGYVVPVVP